MLPSNPTNFEFNGIDQVRKFNEKYLKEGSEKEISFEQDFEAALLTILKSNIPEAKLNLAMKTSRPLQSKEFEVFGEIAKRSFSKLHLPTSDVLKLNSLMNQTRQKLLESTLTNKNRIDQDLKMSAKRLLKNEIDENNSSKIEDAAINNLINENTNDQKKALENLEKVSQPAFIFKSSAVACVAGIGGGIAAGFLGTAFFPVTIPLALTACALLLIGLPLLIVDANPFMESRSMKNDLFKIEEHGLKLQDLRTRIRNPEFKRFIASKVKITDFNEKEVKSILSFIPEWEAYLKNKGKKT